ncbi:hypothetical protein SASPL_135489 [Salvia splendens]|uniref:Uncharacterized protein n=1 Tax=Salvia splendens TaxID=180675 RepID=A0A8X8ZFI8_SALSN|nr:hypothetical protein SASPL_135489 [Salvia splendens]
MLTEKGMTMKGKGTKRESSSSNLDSREPRMDIKSILKDIEFLGKIKSLCIYYYYNPILKKGINLRITNFAPMAGIAPPSYCELFLLCVFAFEEKLLQERAILGRFGAYSSSSSKKVPERKPAEDRILKSMQGDFRKGVLNVGHLLQASNYKGRHPTGKGKKKKDGKKSHGKRKGGGGGGGKRRH